MIVWPGCGRRESRTRGLMEPSPRVVYDRIAGRGLIPRLQRSCTVSTSHVSLCILYHVSALRFCSGACEEVVRYAPTGSLPRRADSPLTGERRRAPTPDRCSLSCARAGTTIRLNVRTKIHRSSAS